jgi:hypothetical protein
MSKRNSPPAIAEPNPPAAPEAETLEAQTLNFIEGAVSPSLDKAQRRTLYGYAEHITDPQLMARGLLAVAEPSVPPISGRWSYWQFSSDEKACRVEAQIVASKVLDLAPALDNFTVWRGSSLVGSLQGEFAETPIALDELGRQYLEIEQARGLKDDRGEPIWGNIIQS